MGYTIFENGRLFGGLNQFVNKPNCQRLKIHKTCKFCKFCEFTESFPQSRAGIIHKNVFEWLLEKEK
jgi:hypothetical protein